MTRIESIAAQPDMAGRYKVTFSDGSAMRLYKQTVQDFGLYTGRELSEDEFESLKKAAQEMSAKMRAVRIVSASAVSKKDLQQRLIQKGEDPEQAKQAVKWMESLDLLDDRKTAEMVVQRCITKGYGISVHKRDCPNVINGKNNPEYANRWVHAEWDGAVLDSKSKHTFEAMIQIHAENSISLIADITIALADMKVSILQINTKKRTDVDIIINLTVACKDIEHYNSIVSRLRSVSNVTNIVRGFS